MRSLFSLRKTFFYLIITSFFLVTSCSKNEDPLSSQEEHFQAIGMAIMDASCKIIVKILRGETSDTLFVPLGARSDAFFVEFYDRNENLIEPPKSNDQKLTWKIDNESIVKVHQHEGEEGGYEFHLDGLIEGTTLIEFFIEHDGHNDFRSGKIPAVVKSFN